MLSTRGPSRRRMAALVLFTGMLFQTASPSCAEIGVAGATSLTTSILNQVIRSSVYQSLGLGSGGSTLGGLGGLGT